MKRICYIISCFFIVHNSFAQIQQNIFPSLTGTALLDSVVYHYKPATVLAWGDAKDTIFAAIDPVNDTVRCVYTGLEKWLDPSSQDPSTFMSMNNNPNGMNIEHTYPQSKGAANGNARADMHHLFPARNETNNMRGNLPFDELNDSLVTNWFYLTFNAQGIPVFNINNYSELINNQAFEPKESWKGNVARAMFYFYTMYRAEANAADSDYFNGQKNVLCNWHIQDPVDQVEWDRTYRVAAYQDNKPNPFILDCSLAKRMYCPNISTNCSGGNAISKFEKYLTYFKVSPNPAQDYFVLDYQLEERANVEIGVYNLLGQKIAVLYQAIQNKGNYKLNVQPQHQWESGLYLIRWQIESGNQIETHNTKLLWGKQ